LFEEIITLARKKDLISDEHFSVDGTLVQAWASQKSFRPRDEDNQPPSEKAGRNAERNFHGEKRLNDTHESKTDPDARIYKKSKGSEAKMAYLGHTLMENRNGLIVGARISHATGTAERDTAVELLATLPGEHRKTVGADKNYDTADFIARCRTIKITPHVAQNEGYQVSMKVRERVEEPFGWGKTVGPIRQVMVRGLDRVNMAFNLTFIGWNLRRMGNIQGRCA